MSRNAYCHPGCPLPIVKYVPSQSSGGLRAISLGYLQCRRIGTCTCLGTLIARDPVVYVVKRKIETLRTPSMSIKLFTIEPLSP